MGDTLASMQLTMREPLSEVMANRASRVRKQKSIFEAGVNRKGAAGQVTKNAAAVVAVTSTEIHETVQLLQAQLGTV
jgi:hypothetical protein